MIRKFLLSVLAVVMLSVSVVADEKMLINALKAADFSWLTADQIIVTPPVNQFTSPTFFDTATLTRNALATTSTDGLVIQNTTAATSGTAVQYSPRLRFCGTAWDTDPTGVSDTNCWKIENQPASAATTTETLVFGASIAGGAYSNALTMTNAGVVTLPSTGVLTWTSPGARLEGSAADGYLIVRNFADSGNGTLEAATIAATGSALTNGSGTGITTNDRAGLRRVTHRVTILSTQFISADVTHDVTVATMPAKFRLAAIYVDLTTTFACTATCTSSTLSITVGSSAGDNGLIVSFDADAATGVFGDADAELGTGINRANAIQGAFLGSWTTTTPISLRLTSGTGNLGDGATTNLSQGTIVIFLVGEQM